MRRVHVWLAWIVGIPLLFWTVSGLWMVARPIDEVRGTDLRAVPVPIMVPSATARLPVGRAAKTLAIEMQAGRAVWTIGYPDGRAARADVATGRVLPQIDAAAAGVLAMRSLARPGAIGSIRFTPADRSPIDLRRARPAWGVTFADGVRVYVDADSGSVLAVRTAQWRWFDWMWGFHIMDLQTREDTSHLTLIVFAAAAVTMTVLGLILLPLASRRRRRR